MKVYNAHNRAGCVQLRRSRTTGTMVGIYHAEQAGLDAEGGAWVTVCEDHGEICEHETLSDARRHAPGVEWCERCDQAQDFSAFARECPERVELNIIRRPANALNIEIGKPQPRCRRREPDEWRGADPRAARWLLSGGDPRVLGTCDPAKCPRRKSPEGG